MVGYTDSDHAGDADVKSRAAYLFKAAGAAISWSTKKLGGVADSTTVAEYKALTMGAKEAISLRQLLGELGMPTPPITLYCDNKSARNLTVNPIMHQRTKHVKIAWHFIREAVKDGDVQVRFVGTALQDADFLTKALDGP